MIPCSASSAHLRITSRLCRRSSRNYSRIVTSSSKLISYTHTHHYHYHYHNPYGYRRRTFYSKNSPEKTFTDSKPDRSKKSFLDDADTTSSTQDALANKMREVASSFTQASKEKSREFLESSKPVASAAVESFVGKTKDVSTRMAKQASKTIKEKTKHCAKSAKHTITNKFWEWSFSFRSAVSRQIRRLTESISRPIRDATRRVSESIQLAPGTAWNKFFYWSLLAISVYGVSTTVPKEIVRNYLQSNKVENKVKEDDADKP